MHALTPLALQVPLTGVDADRALDILLHLLAALALGGVIGMERSYHGRPAGFRTHALVCLASTLLMLLTVHQVRWFPGTAETVRVDPQRMAQGIMTGIGFLGAGVIFKEGKEGVSVRGLTTAASIWITAAIGVLVGAGLYFPAVAGTALTLGVLAAFRWIENRVPAHRFAHHSIRFERAEAMPEPALRDLLSRNGFAVTLIAYRLTEDGQLFEYNMTIRTSDKANFSRLASSLSAVPAVREFDISPTGE
jgi:putative Mg2+ transporter-C (MgtC) family protein